MGQTSSAGANGGVTGSDFVRIVCPSLDKLPEGTRIVLDGAPIHRSSKALARVSQDLVVAWPPHSADLNPIENFWAILDKQVGVMPIMKANPASWNVMWGKIRRAAKEIKQETINNLCDSFTRRLKTCIEKKGD